MHDLANRSEWCSRIGECLRESFRHRAASSVFAMSMVLKWGALCREMPLLQSEVRRMDVMWNFARSAWNRWQDVAEKINARLSQ